ncbi:xanthine dehydrogenase [candidate division LCP-89 bacterium B3_LCP]|uniref:Xanthine dehydrogenase n=1 Tax=candidate division LCP-89 bacterium B3_LCP TaxID=2012998 RepID=A0A532V3W7_UNCL8|nr:MAG: xanthine dehydrogenase [candidate division LCP-89 bacterium B3_LCP]
MDTEINKLDVWKELTEIEKAGISSALVTVIATKGSTPREVGAKMIVFADGRTSGTVGGSAVEVLIIKDAVDAIKEGKAHKVEYKLHQEDEDSTGMLCGGVMEFFIEPLKRVPRLYIFGGGHVGLALAKLVTELGYPYTVLDDRAEFASDERFPHADERISGPYDELTDNLELIEPAYIVIVTAGHDSDLKVLRGVLGKKYHYLGMICSKKKKVEVFKILEDEGFSKGELEKVHAPIGLKIGGRSPAEIAVSIMAEVMQVFYQAK